MWEKSKLKKLEIGQKWNFSCFFIFLWSNICVRGPNLFILVFFQLNLLSNVKYFMKKTFLNNHLFPLKDVVNLWNDFKTLYTVFFLFLREIYKKTSVTRLACTSICPIFSETWILSHFPSLVVSQHMKVNVLKIDCYVSLWSWFSDSHNMHKLQTCSMNLLHCLSLLTGAWLQYRPSLCTL